MPVIRFGHTINDVSLENLEAMLRVCKDKIIIDLDGTDIYTMFKNSRYHKLLECKNVEQLSEMDKNYMFELHK
jgi:hypothetical protein